MARRYSRVVHRWGRLLAALVLLAVPAGNAPARAQTAPPADSASRAREHAAQGRRLYDLRRYDEAIPQFEQAYRLDNDPAHLYNIAQAHRLANHVPEAIAGYRAYLDRLPDAPNRRDVEGRIAELSASQRPPNGLDPQPPPPAPPATYPPAPQAGYQPTPSYYPPAVAATSSLPGYHSHDGFFLRMQLGLGFTSLSADRADVRVSGASGHFSLAVGGTLSGKLALFGELGGGSVTEPRVTVGNQSAKFDGELSVFTFGAGAAYYFMPINVYLSATLGGSQVTLKVKDPVGDRTLESKTGLGLTLSAGKEWWAARDVGLGLALQLHGSAVKENVPVDPDTLTPGWVSLVFSGTYN
jgi:tetratricopeptide (TPR) repeat protein